MKILAVASLTPSATANYIIGALREAKHDLYVCSDVANPLADQLVFGAVDVAKLSLRCPFTPDLLLFIEGGTMRLFPKGLERLKCLTAWYGIDTHMDYAKHLRIGRLFDITFVAQKKFVEKLRSDGLRQIFWLPLGFAPELHPQEQLDRCYEVAYVGSVNAVLHPVRHALLAAISREVSEVFKGMASPKEMGRIYAQAKMVFNKSVNNDINMRYFEAMGAGAVLITDHVTNNGIEELFTVGEHFLEYQDEGSLLALIRELRSNPHWCRRLGDAARCHVMKNHTYAFRARSALEKIVLCEKSATPTPDAYFAAFTSLRIADGALSAAMDAFDWRTAGPSQWFLAWMIIGGLLLLTLGTRVVQATSPLAELFWKVSKWYRH